MGKCSVIITISTTWHNGQRWVPSILQYKHPHSQSFHSPPQQLATESESEIEQSLVGEARSTLIVIDSPVWVVLYLTGFDGDPPTTLLNLLPVTRSSTSMSSTMSMLGMPQDNLVSRYFLLAIVSGETFTKGRLNLYLNITLHVLFHFHSVWNTSSILGFYSKSLVLVAALITDWISVLQPFLGET